MKNGYAILLFAAVITSPKLEAQYATNVLDTNDVRARFLSNGRLGNPNSMQPGFHVPSGSGITGPSPLFASSIWVAGLDLTGTIRLAAERFQPNGPGFFPGPLGTDASITPTTSLQYDQVWKVDQSDVDRQVAYFQCLADPTCNAQTEYPGYAIPTSFFSWPAHGDVSEGQAYNLAPYIDFNNDGNYNPEEGDAPCISGDQALFTIYNDVLQPNADQIGLEVHMMPFAFASDIQAIDQTIFIRYRLINRGPHTLHDTYVGFWNDYDLGGANDDYLGCDVGRNLFYVYNGDSLDEGTNDYPGYGLYPPAFGEVLLQGPLMDTDAMDNTDTLSLPGYNGTGFNDGVIDNERLGMGYSLSLNNGPTDAASLYGYLHGQWQDGTPFTYGGNGYNLDSNAVQAHYMFPGDSDPLGVGTNGQVVPSWTETSSGNAPGDRRGMASMGPFTFAPGQEEVIVVAYVYARTLNGDLYASVHALQERTDSMRAFAQTIPGLLGEGSPCEGLITGITTKVSKDLGLLLYPNPANDRLHVVLQSAADHATISVFDCQGALVLRQEVNSDEKIIDVTQFSSGLYLAKVQSGGKSYSRSFVKE